MKRLLNVFLLVIIFILGLFIYKEFSDRKRSQILSAETKAAHWFLLHRKSQKEYLFFGTPGKKDESTLVKSFKVKTGTPGQRPTPLPQLVGREYWKVIDETDVSGHPETSPYFLSLDIPYSDAPPYGPQPYLECDGQCDWVLPGNFGLHGTGGVPERLSKEDPGSSGCIRHSDEDITYLYNILDPEREEIRYYIENI